MVFPELSRTGHFVRERYHETALRNDDPSFTHRELGRILYGKRILEIEDV